MSQINSHSKWDFPHAILKFLFNLVAAVLFVGKHGKAEDNPAGIVGAPSSRAAASLSFSNPKSTQCHLLADTVLILFQ